MLYHPFRNTLLRIQAALENFSGHTGPDLLETPSPELQRLLDRLDWTRARLATFLECLPETCSTAPEDEHFGPVVHVDDMHLAASIVVPLALSLDATIPTESYGPVDFLGEKLVVLLGAIQIYSGWKQYTVGPHPTQWRGFARLISSAVLSDVALLDPDTPYLGRLFQNISESASQARTGLEYYLGQTAGTV